MEKLTSRQQELLNSKHVNWFFRDKYFSLYWRVKRLDRKRFMRLDKQDKILEIYNTCSDSIDLLKKNGVNEHDEFYKSCVRDLNWITEYLNKIV